MDRVTALLGLSATQYLGRWRAAFTYRPGMVLFGGAVIAWAGVKYAQFLRNLDKSLPDNHAAASITVVMAMLGCFAALPILVTLRPAGGNPRWRLLPLTDRERVFLSAFQLVFQAPFILLVCTAAATAWVCRRQINPGIWLLWVALAMAFWTNFVHMVYRKLNLAGSVVLASVCGGTYAAFAFSAIVSRTIIRLTSHLEGWQPRFWSLATATFAVVLIALGGGEALCRFIPILRARSGVSLRKSRVEHRHWLTIWLTHEWHCWSGCLHPYLAILLSVPLLYYLCFNPHPSLIAAFAATGFLALIDAAPLTNVFGRESCAVLDRFATTPLSGRRILDLETSGVLIATAGLMLPPPLVIGARFGLRACLGSGLVCVAITLALLTLGEFASALWPRRIHPYRGGGAGSLPLAFSILVPWGIALGLGVLYSEGQVRLVSLMLLSAIYAILYWLCRPRAGRMLERKLWRVRTRLRREEF
jgi:hypothetical protein